MRIDWRHLKRKNKAWNSGCHRDSNMVRSKRMPSLYHLHRNHWPKMQHVRGFHAFAGLDILIRAVLCKNPLQVPFIATASWRIKNDKSPEITWCTLILRSDVNFADAFMYRRPFLGGLYLAWYNYANHQINPCVMLLNFANPKVLTQDPLRIIGRAHAGTFIPY